MYGQSGFCNAARAIIFLLYLYQFWAPFNYVARRKCWRLVIMDNDHSSRNWIINHFQVWRRFIILSPCLVSFGSDLSNGCIPKESQKSFIVVKKKKLYINLLQCNAIFFHGRWKPYLKCNSTKEYGAQSTQSNYIIMYFS